MRKFVCHQSKIPYECVYNSLDLKLKSVNLSTGIKLAQLCDVSQIEELSEKMGKTMTNVKKIGKQLTSIKRLTLSNLLFYGEHLYVRQMLPENTMLDSLTIIAEKRKSRMAYQCKAGEDFELPSISNVINKQFTHFVKETHIHLNDDWLQMDLQLKGEGISQIQAD